MQMVGDTCRVGSERMLPGTFARITAVDSANGMGFVSGTIRQGYFDRPCFRVAIVDANSSTA